MNLIEETNEAMLESNGELRLTHPPPLSPGPVQVTIRVVARSRPRRGIADLIREIRADQIARGFTGRSTEELQAEEEERLAEDAERDRELDAARRKGS